MSATHLAKQSTMEADSKRNKILRLNVIQTWVIIIATVLGIVAAITAFAKGWVNLPERVQAIEESQRPLMPITNRVDQIEKTQVLMWQKLTTDHDLLTGINQKLTDMDERQKEVARDVKDLGRK